MPNHTEHEAALLRLRILDRATAEYRGADSPCWVSNRVAQPNGYTKFGYRGATLLTHRLAYEVFVGPIPEGLVIDHLCRVRACVNPEHLEAVTTRENLVRGDTVTAREVAQTHCLRGHALTEDNIYRRADKPSSRTCRKCIVIRNQNRAGSRAA